MALAFILFFGLVTVAVLRFADAVELQNSRSTASGTSEAALQGAALYATAAVNPTGAGAFGGDQCVVNFSSPTVGGVRYTTKSCTPLRCDLCLLGGSSQTDLTLGAGVNVSVHGPIVINGDASLARDAALTSISQPSFIGCGGGSCTSNGRGGGYSPSPQPIARITDALPPPCSDCSVNPQPPVFVPPGDSQTLWPGQYSSIVVQGPPPDCAPDGLSCQPAKLTLMPGVYRITSSFLVSGSASVTEDGPVTLLFAPGASFHASGGATVNLLEPFVPPPPGMSTGLSMYWDPGGAGDITVSDPGTTVNLGGALYAPSMAVQVLSTTSLEVGGDLIADSLQVDPGGQLTIGGSPPSGSLCLAYRDALSWTGTVTGTPEALVESQCGGTSALVEIDYGE
jgi:hypothetical protein